MFFFEKKYKKRCTFYEKRLKIEEQIYKFTFFLKGKRIPSHRLIYSKKLYTFTNCALLRSFVNFARQNFKNKKIANMRLNLNLLMLLSIVVLMSSCVSKKKWTQLLSDKEATDQMLAAEKSKTAELEGKVAGLESDQAALKEETVRLANEVSQFKSDLESSQASAAEAMSKLKLSESDLSSLKTNVQAAVSGGGFDLSPKDGRLFVTMTEPILFNSGSVRVKKGYKPTLESMAAVLKGNPSLRLIIEGHSDNVPVKAGVAYSDNWDVSLARAKSVVTKLTKMGVSPNQLLPTGRGEYDPVSSENTAESRKMNRRVDFIVMPDLKTLIDAARP